MKRVVQKLEKTFSEIHVSDGVDRLVDSNGSGDLTVMVGPVVLEVLHVPLVDNNYYSLSVISLHLSEDILTSLVNNDSLQVREEVGHGGNIPVDKVSVKALLRIGRGSNKVELSSLR